MGSWNQLQMNKNSKNKAWFRLIISSLRRLDFDTNNFGKTSQQEKSTNLILFFKTGHQ